MTDTATRIAELRRRIEDANRRYHELDDPDITDAQYDALIALTLQLQGGYPAITVQRICGHSDVAPGRKTDPGPKFDWQRYRGALQHKGEMQ